MVRLFSTIAVLGFSLSVCSPAWAIKPFSDSFKAIYAGDDATEEFKTLVGEAKCNVCHVEKEDKKKVRNSYGKALHDMLEKDEFPIDEFKKDQAKYADRLKEIIKKTEGEASGDEKHKTFGDRIKANLLPGGDKDGKK
jgi:DNA polymerase III sliding clamp (beta) subunit (PCNA family)